MSVLYTGPVEWRALCLFVVVAEEGRAAASSLFALAGQVISQRELGWAWGGDRVGV